MNAPDPARTALQALLHFQTQTQAQAQAQAHAAEAPQPDPAAAAARLQAFASWCQQHPRGHAWSEAEQAAWSRIAQALLLAAAAQPVVALQQGGHGPLLHELAGLLRPEGVHDDEAAELDLAIRWWEGARRAGLPVDPDFGEVWQALEWTALQQHLLRLAEGAAAAEPALLQAVAKVALRYSPLKPLLRLLPAQPGAEVGAGFTF